MDPDSDNDGFSDAIEGGRRYPGFDAAGRALTCGAAADNCDGAGDRVANFQDTDSDNDGLSDAAERAARTDPCAEDTDGDGASKTWATPACSSCACTRASSRNRALKL